MGDTPQPSNGLILMEISKIRIDERRGEQVVVLKERDGNRFLPIIIGISEVTVDQSQIELCLEMARCLLDRQLVLVASGFQVA